MFEGLPKPSSSQINVRGPPEIEGLPNIVRGPRKIADARESLHRTRSPEGLCPTLSTPVGRGGLGRGEVEVVCPDLQESGGITGTLAVGADFS